MKNLQETLDSLQPFLIGIRYLEGTPLVDVVFKDGWTIPEDPNVKKIKGNDDLNYYMVFSEVKGIGLDELLLYVEKAIKLNQEREKKHDLLREKVNELKEVFKKNSLSKLSRLKFSFSDEDLVPKLDEFNIDIDMELKEPQVVKQTETQQHIEEIEVEVAVATPSQYLDENRQPIELTEEDKEILAEEARAERNRQILTNKKQKQSSISKKVELPPKRKIEMAISERDYESDCDCGENDACEKCIDKKGY